MRYCGHFLIKAEGGAKNYERDHPLPLSWRPFTVVFVHRKGYISYRPVPTVDSRYIEPRSSGYRPRTLVLYIDYRPGDRSITYTYIRTASARICTPPIVSRSLRSLANKYSTLPCGIYCTLGSEYLSRPSTSGNIPTLGAIFIDIPRGRVEYL